MSELLQWWSLQWSGPLQLEDAVRTLRRRAADPLVPRLVLEAWGQDGQVRFLVGAEGPVLRRLAGELAGEASAGRLVPTTAFRPTLTAAGELAIAGGRTAALAVERSAETAHAVLAALAQASSGNALVLQLVLGRPRRPLVTPAAPQATPLPVPLWPRPAAGTGAERRRALKDKVAQHGFECAVRLGVAGADRGEGRWLLLALLGALRTLEAPGVHLSLRRLQPEKLTAARSPWRWPLRLNVAELAALSGWPIGEPPFAGLPAPHPTRLLADPRIARHGRVVALGEGNDGGTRPLALSAPASLQHLHVLGPTGTGKSTLLLKLAVQDMHAGRSLVVIDPLGGLVADLLARVPVDRLDDVVVLDATDPTPVGLNPLTLTPGRSAEAAADGVLAVFKGLYADSWGPRTQDILHACLLTLTRHGSTSLVMVPLLLTNAGFRRSLTARASREDPLGVGSFWAWYEATSEPERAAAIASLMNKLRSVLLRPGLRAVLGQREPRFSISQVFTERRVLLVNLAKGLLGPDASALLGSLVIAQLWQTTLARAAVAPDRRHPVSVYVDEVQDYLHLPTDLADALAQARGLGVGFTLAHQFLAQLTPAMRAAVLANARSRVYFQLPPDDAATAARGHSELFAEDFTSLGVFEVYASLLSKGQATAYAFGRTLPAAAPTSDPGALRAASRQRWGRPLSEVEAGWQAMTAETSESIGRRPRRSA